MKVNVRNNVMTFEGGKAQEVNPYQRLKRTILACMLFEDNFYEDGIKAADRISELSKQCTFDQLSELILECSKRNLRHITLQMIVEALKKKDCEKPNFFKIIDQVIVRPDMMTDLIALYWKEGKKPLAHQLKKGLAKAFTKFDRYQLGKYNRDGAIKLRDVLFLCHAKPIDKDQDELWKRLINKTLETPDTWETRLSSGQDKGEAFSELLSKGKMGKLAILRNMRNMHDAGIDKNVVAFELLRNSKEMLPFQYLAAARECPAWEDIIDQAMINTSALKPKMDGKTIVLVDVSGSMDQVLSSKSVMKRMDAACGMAILLRECIDDVTIMTFSNLFVLVPNRHGMALRDAIVKSQSHSSTFLGNCLTNIVKSGLYYDRLIVITDEQTGDNIPHMPRGKNYILNIAGYQNGIGNVNQWTTITGFSEASIDFIRELEEMQG